MARGSQWGPWLLFLALGFLLTGPAWIRADAYVGELDSNDLQGSIWAYWWSLFSLENGLNPFSGTHNFYPVGQEPV